MIVRVNTTNEMGMVLTEDVKLNNPDWEDIKRLNVKEIQMSADEFNHLYMTRPIIED